MDKKVKTISPTRAQLINKGIWALSNYKMYRLLDVLSANDIWFLEFSPIHYSLDDHNFDL